MALTDKAGSFSEMTVALSTEVSDTLSNPTEATSDPADPGMLAPGTRVEVRTRLDSRRWARGFEILASEDGGYRLRRLSDGDEMPVLFAADDIRVERKRDIWWY